MMAAALPQNEPARLALLESLKVLDTAPDAVLYGLVRCTAQMLGYPLAMVSLVDVHRQWFMARHGVTVSETPREHAFCAHAILSTDLFEVPDTHADPRFADNPMVLGEPHVRSYAGMPLSIHGLQLGTLCVVDEHPRSLTPAQVGMLSDLAHAVSAWFESRQAHLQLQDERLRSDERLALLSKLAEQTPGMLFQYRVDASGQGGFSYVSAQAREMFGLAPEALLGDLHVLLELVHPDDRAELRRALQQAAQDQAPWHRDFRVVLPGAVGACWRAARASPSRMPDGEVLWHGFVADVTDQVEVEQLRRDKLAAERASAEKSQFLARVSHELRTPLNAMMGFTQLMQIDRQDPLTPRQSERVDHAHRSAKMLLGLINDVLDLSRIEQGAHEFVIGPVDAEAVARSCLAMLTQVAQEAGVHTELKRLDPDALACVAADCRALEQVMLNLLSNGIKYNRRGGRLSVLISGDAREVQVSVCDQGQGLDSGQQARLFQPFNRLGAEHGPVEGSGLGLVISRQLVEAMSGRISVLSTPGQGSTFTVTLPRHSGQAMQLEDVLPPLPAKTVDVDRQITLLYIEDEPLNALLVEEALRLRPNWRLLHALDGRSGLALAKARRPTLVLTDINLPGMSGLEVVKAIRADPSIQHTVCIALSANAMGQQVDEAMRAGFDDYWTKPLDVCGLPERIDTWLARITIDSGFAELAEH